jgi:WS/DGAT/MGAT family acyltransferase
MTDVAASRPLSASDSLMWRIEADPVLRSAVLVVGMLDRSPEPARLRAAVDRASREVPGLRERLVPSRHPLDHPTWRAVVRFSLDHHLRRAHVPGGGLRDVLDLAEPDATAPFDHERPPWSLTIVDGLEGGGAAFVLRFHHAISDGVGGLRLARHLLDSTRRAPAARPAPAQPAPPAPEGRTRPAALLERAGGAVVRAAATARDPMAVAARSAQLGRSLWRFLQPTPSDGSPLLAGRSLDRTLDAFEVPLADLRRAAAAAGGTVNDVLLAAVGGAFRAYHEHHGHVVDTMRTSMPVDRRRADDPEGGNHFTMARFPLPVDDPDPVTRARIAGAIVRGWRAEPALGATDVVAAGLDLLPASTVARVFGALLRRNDVNVVDLRGLDEPALLAGARVERLWAFAPTAGTAYSVTLLSHRDAGCVTVVSDRASVTDPALLASCLAAAFHEVLAPAPGRSTVGESA